MIKEINPFFQQEYEKFFLENNQIFINPAHLWKKDVALNMYHHLIAEYQKIPISKGFW